MRLLLTLALVGVFAYLVGCAVDHEARAAASSPAVRAIRQVFPAHAEARAVRVAWCESRLKPLAVSRTGDYGLFQINRQAHRSWVDFRPHRIFDPVYNARVALRLSRGGRSWSPWKWSAHCWGRA